ncbi:MAG TPA: tyrosine-type recombinase/integrase [Candidatus Angelobacter sp.]|nr:tyrosine-type recombinase/integrase [Candidatus Angelobacter sp.]
MNRQPKAQASRVNITKYVKVATANGEGWRFCPVVRSTNGRIRADYVLVEGRAELHKEGAYYIEWYAAGKRRRESVGRNPLDAFAAAERKEQILKNAALGIQVVGEDKRKQTMLSEACQAFIDDTRLLKRPKTHSQYKTALEYFQESCLDKPLSSVERTDLTRFMGFLAEQKKLESRTIWNKIQVVISMLKANGITRLLRQRDWPRYTESTPEVFTADEIRRFLGNCEGERRTVFEFFWMTGFREQEVQYVTWPDVDFIHRVIRVKAKPKLGFIPKDWEEREVPMSDQLYRSLRFHKAKVRTGCLLVFATSNGQVVHNFLRQCKSVAWHAGLNCGSCYTGQGHCASGPYCQNWFLHKFRETFATMHLRAGVDLRTVQEWMGHKDLESTSRYLQPARGREALALVNNTFTLNSKTGDSLHP